MTASLSQKTRDVWFALRQSTEGDRYAIGEKTFRDVYLDNALAKLSDMTPRSFAGHLSALERAGLYIAYGDDCFGKVALEG